MNRPSLLVLVRHGQSLRNVAPKRNRFFLDDEARKSIKGLADHKVPLTELGRQQAQAAGVALRRTFGVFDDVIHSGYTRTVETTDAILAAYTAEERARMVVRHHLFIRERDQGFAYDMTDAEANAAFPWLQDYWQTFGPFFARPPGGESLAEVCERVYSFLQKMARNLAGRRVLLVAHGGTIWCFRYVLERWTYAEAEERFQTEAIPNCSVASYRLDTAVDRLVLDMPPSILGDPAGLMAEAGPLE